MVKRDTRVQVVVIENGKYILVRHLFKEENREFWAVPGGGVEPGETEEEAAVREVREETCLDIRLLPVKFETAPAVTSLYRRMVTFIGYPVSGDAHLGCEPEEELSRFYSITSLKWQDVYDDSGLDPVNVGYIRRVRDYLATNPFTLRAGALVYRHGGKKVEYLMVTPKTGADIYIFPQGHVEPGETPAQAAKREALEEAGADVSIEKNLGFFFHEKKGAPCRADIFLASLISQGTANEGRRIAWLGFEDLAKVNVQREALRFIREIHGELSKHK